MSVFEPRSGKFLIDRREKEQTKRRDTLSGRYGRRELMRRMRETEGY